MGDKGFVQLPIEEYHRLYEAEKELIQLKDTLVVVEENYNKIPEMIATIPKELVQAAWNKEKENWPEHECSSDHDTQTEVWGAITKKQPSVTLDFNEGDE